VSVRRSSLLPLRVVAATVIIVGIWFVGVPLLLVSLQLDPMPMVLGPWRLVGLVPLGVGAVLFAWVTWTFAAAGDGTPLVFDAPRRFVAAGPHRWSRNPMYVADVLVVLGIALVLESSAVLVYAGVLALGLHVMVVTIEEPRLRARFGAEYERYCQRVPRWLARPRATPGVPGRGTDREGGR
jgi:protein-S-isoprenylcysteine O-methyltransferase Ste14